MPAELRLRVIGGPEAMAALAARGASVRSASKRALSDSIDVVQRRAVGNLRGLVLRVDTGRLWQSVAANKWMAADGSRGGFGTNVEYARIHEFGGTIRPHEIRPRRGKALFFGGRFASRVQHPGALMPARPYMRPALEDSQEEIKGIFMTRLLAALKGQQ